MDETTISRLRIFVDKLNIESENGSIIVVEGKRDVEALIRVGFTGNITVLNRYKGINNFVDNTITWAKRNFAPRHGQDWKISNKQKQSRCVGGNVSLFYKKPCLEYLNGKVDILRI